MKYMLMLFDDGDAIAEAEADVDMEVELQEKFEEWCANQGIDIVGGEALQAPSNATTVRRSGDEVLVTDGPVAEVKEQLGGYYILECRDLDQAIEAARRCPGVKAIEVRPVWDFG